MDPWQVPLQLQQLPQKEQTWTCSTADYSHGGNAHPGAEQASVVAGKSKCNGGDVRAAAAAVVVAVGSGILQVFGER